MRLQIKVEELVVDQLSLQEKKLELLSEPEMCRALEVIPFPQDCCFALLTLLPSIRRILFTSNRPRLSKVQTSTCRL